MIVVLLLLATAQLVLAVVEMAHGEWSSGLLLLATGLGCGSLAARGAR
jgi:hypothetical protein